MINRTIGEKKGSRLIKGGSKKTLSKILKIRNEREIEISFDQIST